MAIAAALVLLIFLSLGILIRLRPDDGFDLPAPQFIDVGGNQMAYYRQGAGPQVMLLHGLGASSYCWRYLFPLLTQDHEVIAFDLIGFGRSHKVTNSKYILEEQGNWLFKAMEQLNIRPAVVVGSSMGGLLALWLAKFHSDRIPKVIALAPAAIGKRSSRHFHTSLGRAIHHGLYSWTMPWIVLFVVGTIRPLNRRSVKEYLRPFREPGSAFASYNAGLALFDPRLPGLFSGLKTPTRILWGRGDRLVSRRVMNDLRRILPEASFEELASGHHPQEHIPEKLADEIRAYLKS